MSSSTDLDASSSSSRDHARRNDLHNLVERYGYQSPQSSGYLQQAPPSSSFSSSVGGGGAPPSQSRDATARSRFFPPSTSNAHPSFGSYPSSIGGGDNGNILVPNSSPMAQRYPQEHYPFQPAFHGLVGNTGSSAAISNLARPQGNYGPSSSGYGHGYGHGFGFGNGQGQGQGQGHSWGHQGGFNGSDPLSRSSGFVSSSSSSSSIFQPPYSQQQQHLRLAPILPPGRSAVRRVIDDDGESGSERPRKRLSRRQTPEKEVVLVGDSSPEMDAASPDVVRLGQKRRPGTGRRVDSPTPSEESFPSDAASLLSGSSKSRLFKQSTQPTPSSSARTVDHNKQMAGFTFMFPLLDPKMVTAVLEECRYNQTVASALLLDDSYVAKRVKEEEAKAAATAAASAPARPVVGRVTEIDEEREKARAAEKEKAARSAIYRRRAEMEGLAKLPTPATPPPASSSIVTIPDTPDSPVLQRRMRQKTKRAVVDSGSEGEEEEEVKVVSFLVEKSRGRAKSVDSFTERALHSFNNLAKDALRELTGCTPEHADAIVKVRPFSSVEDLEQKLGLKKKKSGPAGLSPRIFDDCVEIHKGYGTVDGLLAKCEVIGQDLSNEIAAWTEGKEAAQKATGKEKAAALIDSDIAEDGALNLHSLPSSSTASRTEAKGLLTKAPALLASGVQLKDYQLVGISWLNLLRRKKLSCILADEMGLGKTVQVISLIAHLKAGGNRGPHLIVVPSSTLENWCREFERFAPSIAIQTYYADKDERPILRQTLRESMASKRKLGTNSWEVLITTYNLAVGDNHDKKFFRNIPWETCVFDEGHVLKNYQSQRYSALVKIEAKWKLLLTGTPLQNNLQELVSIMFFILPNLFSEGMDDLRTVFKVRAGESKVHQLLAEERVSRAKKMMTPFVLRRRKDQVLKDLPKKTERIEWCEMTTGQKRIYREAMQRSRKTILELAEATLDQDVKGSSKPVAKPRATAKGKENKVYVENSANVLMDLRKAALHPMLFRTRFDDKTLSDMTKLLLKEPDFKKRGAIFQFVKEDMEVMTDAELQVFVKTYKSTTRFVLDEDCYVDAGKVKMLLKLLDRYRGEGRKCLIFSQFTQVLDILQVILKQRSIKYLLLTGSTPVDVRQGLVDEFTEDTDMAIPVFLLSTKAGGMGINLTAASVVIMFDQDFNPHNDKQAADRAYRIGQKRDVEVVKLVTRGTIEEDMLRLGQTKLALDEAVAGEAAAAASADSEVSNKGGKESAPEKIMRESLVESLRKQFEKEAKSGPNTGVDDSEKTGDKNEDIEMVEARGKKRASVIKRKGGANNGEVKSKKASRVIDIDSDSELTDLE